MLSRIGRLFGGTVAAAHLSWSSWGASRAKGNGDLGYRLNAAKASHGSATRLGSNLRAQDA